ncbi:GMP synthase [glutamine-hydrolyzing] [Candidatus Erwinia haradaeae]|uniref:GMP synthase [glutamine-hydrolyzing] n=1 Tax=Candidatus Erwinia haradaeae TaxID=1922217 RepID=A0A451DJ06_9GAMM|nr:glutamine-hydrolyzing GMP synthase [Candidatus Erwinia haradaeae]VFP86690.1 GMP synthase [glutamine-hydrolyzing] [Candidatus Erwinia haradaeae]
MLSQNIYTDRILILDFGSQYTQLLARRIRSIGVYCTLLAWNASEKQIRECNPNGIILSGGPESSITHDSPRAVNYIFHAGVPILGICYGMQVMAVQLGGNVQSSNQREFGYAQITITGHSPLLPPLLSGTNTAEKILMDVWMSHSDHVSKVPSNFITIASTEKCPVVIMANEKQRFYGVQFHPEVTHTPKGLSLIEQFVRMICQCTALWTSKNIIDDTTKQINNQITNDRVILGLSGGVDSSVTALLLHHAIGNRLICVFIDNGLLRLGEAQQVITMFSNSFGLNIIHIAAEERFLQALSGIQEPEAKRKIIGRVFIEIFEEEAARLGNIKWLAQGTIYSDVIESGMTSTAKTRVIKSHHNVGGLPKKMRLQLLEPLKTLFKDEVREIGMQLGLSSSILHRHPFPGPGLSVRILGEVTKEYCNLLRSADAILVEELHKANLYNKVSQAFTVFLPIRSVSVIGDNRKYDWVIAVRAVETTDFMTAQWANLTYEFLSTVSNRIINEIQGISRVVYDISSKPPATIEWE